MHKSKPRRLLVIRLSAMGDVAMTLPVLKALCENHPQLQITLLTRPFFSPIFTPLDQIRVFEADLKGRHKGFLGLWKLYRELSAMDFEAVADLHNVLRTKVLKVFFGLGGIRFVQIDKGRTEKRRLTALQNKDFRPLQTTHQRYAAVFEKLGYTLDLGKIRLLDKQPLSPELKELVGNGSRKLIGVAPFAAFAGKQYPEELMKEVLAGLYKTNQYKIFLFGGVSDSKLLDSWCSEVGNCVNMAGKLDFKDELALISNLDLMLSMDSANAHLAANFGIKVVTLWGLTHPYAGFYPFGQDPSNALLSDREKYPAIPTSVYGKSMPKGYENVMETIHPTEVIANVEKLLGDS